MNAGDFGALGFDAIPLRPGRKEPFCDGWQRLAPATQWQDAPIGANIGLRGGGDVRAAFLDCDNPETWETARRWAAGLGYMPDGDYPLVSTASGSGRHVYLRLADALPGHWKRLRRDFGKGELRFGPASYVVAVGSVVDGRAYELLQGDLRQLPRLERADLADLVDVSDAPTLRITETPALPRRAQAILDGKAAVVGRYPTRSEAEAAAITAMVNAGFDFGGVLAQFQLHPGAGKYAELRQKSEREALRWLRLTYDKQAAWAQTHESAGRKAAREALTWALQSPWPGRTGNSDRAVFLAHCVIAWSSGALTYAAAVRRIAELGGVALETAAKANKRLVGAGLVKKGSGSFVSAATTYMLGRDKVSTLPHTPPRGEVYQVCPSDDAWRFRGLGKSAAHVWAVLRENPGLTVGELTEATGKHIKTVRRAISRMQRIIGDGGELLRLVEPDGDGWRTVDADLDVIAHAIGTAGAGERQRAAHAEQRAGFARAVDRARAGTTPVRGPETREERLRRRGGAERLAALVAVPGHGDDLRVMSGAAPVAQPVAAGNPYDFDG